MALHELATEEMAVITKHWIAREHQRPLIERFARLAAFLPDIEEVHGNIAVFQNRSRRDSTELASLQSATSRLDAEHDRMARGIRYFLLAATELADGDAKAQWERLYQELFPQGLAINQQRYLVQAGEAQLREHRLSPASRSLLEETSVTFRGHTTTLRELVTDWNKVAEELGIVESQKARLESSHTVESSRGPARRAWVATVGLFLQVLESEKGLTDAERNALLEPLRKAEAKAAKRRALAKKKNQPFDPDAEVPEEELAS